MPYNSKLNIVPQADYNASSLLDSSVLQSPRQSIAPLVELSIRQALSDDNSASKVNSLGLVPEGLNLLEEDAFGVGAQDCGVGAHL